MGFVILFEKQRLLHMVGNINRNEVLKILIIISLTSTFKSVLAKNHIAHINDLPKPST